MYIEKSVWKHLNRENRKAPRASKLPNFGQPPKVTVLRRFQEMVQEKLAAYAAHTDAAPTALRRWRS